MHWNRLSSPTWMFGQTASINSLLADDASGIGDEQRQHVECFRPQLDGFAIGPAQLGALLIEFKISKTEDHAFAVPGSRLTEQHVSEIF